MVACEAVRIRGHNTDAVRGCRNGRGRVLVVALLLLSMTVASLPAGGCAKQRAFYDPEPSYTLEIEDLGKVLWTVVQIAVGMFASKGGGSRWNASDFNWSSARDG